MPVNRNALIRYRTIDQCLQNRRRQWTLDDLIEACGDALYEYQGIDTGVSRRTVQADMEMMRSNKLGYEAPIVVVDKKYYTYSDKYYSIANSPLNQQDMQVLSEVSDLLKQFKGFNHFTDLNEMVSKLEDKIYSQKTHSPPVIDFEKNDNLKGLEYIE
ncbi:MAG: helix-turn-helix transcriptional regulator, partial [Mucilaginibacter sp.]